MISRYELRRTCRVPSISQVSISFPVPQITTVTRFRGVAKGKRMDYVTVLTMWRSAGEHTSSHIIEETLPEN